MKISPLSLLPFCFALSLQAQLVSEFHDFNDTNAYPAGEWLGSDGWWAWGVGGSFYIASGSGDGSNYVGFNNSGSGVGATAWRDIAPPATDEKFSLTFSYLATNYWGTLVGVGNGVLSGLAVQVQTYDGFQVQLKFNGIPGAAAPLTLASGVDWYDFRADVDLAANDGTGALSLYYRHSGDAWTPVDGLLNFALQLDASRTDSGNSNPLTWGTLWFHHEGSGSGIDNVGISAIPEPSTYALMGGLLAIVAVMAVRRRQQERAQE